MSSTPEVRCPRCGGLLTPDQIRAARPTADCTFCQMSVLVRRPEPVPETPPVAMPKGFHVSETPAPKPGALVRVDGDPYREPGRALDRPPGLAISWTEDRPYLRVGLVLVNMLTGAMCAGVWIALVLAARLDINRIIAALVGTWIAGGFAWFTRALWGNTRWVRADHEGLHWRRLTRTARWVPALLPAAEIAQLFVRDETDRDDDYFEVPTFVLYARDRQGRDHVIVQVEDPEQAWWLEARLEEHLGIVNRRIEGEHRRPPST